MMGKIRLGLCELLFMYILFVEVRSKGRNLLSLERSYVIFLS